MIDLTSNGHIEEEIRPAVNTKGGATFQDAYEILYYTRLFKYVHQSAYKEINKNFKKIATKPNLKILCDLGYLKESNQIYTATNKKTMPLLERAGLPAHLLPEQPNGQGGIDEINNTQVFIQATRLPHFYSLCYKTFKFIGNKGLSPDALLVEKKDENYKLTFLEIEAKKYDWSNYIERKRDK